MNKPQYVLAAYYNDEKILARSSSGGIFSAFCRQIFREGGVVYATEFDADFIPRFSRAVNDSQALGQIGSKYIQSYVTKELIDKIAIDLADGKLVMFVGTPCQVAGVKAVLPSNEHIIYVDIICHGVSSPRIWTEYLDFIKNKNRITKLEYINFRDKRIGWDKSRAVCYANGKEFSIQSFMEMYGEATIIRPSCYKCRFATRDRVSDITIGDFWGIQHIKHEWYVPKRGTSIIMINTKHGECFVNDVHEICFSEKMSIDDIPLQMNLVRPTSRPKKRDRYWNEYYSKGFRYVVGVYGGEYGVGFAKKKVRRCITQLINKLKGTNE